MIRFSPLTLLLILGTAPCLSAHAQDDPDLPAPATSDSPAQTAEVPPTSATPQPLENDFRLEPGARAGDVLLGMTSKAILALKGKPSELFPRSQGVDEIVWRTGEDSKLRVILASDLVVQIEVSDPRYKDAFGNSRNSPMNTILARYRAKGYDAPKRSLFETTNANGEFESSLYDDDAAGIAFVVSVSKEFTPDAPGSLPPTSIIIHRAAKAALPTKNAAAVTAFKKEQLQNPPPEPAPAPAPPPRPRLTRAVGNGWPLTEKVSEDGSRGWETELVILPSQVSFDFYAFTSPPPGQAIWHPLVWMSVLAVQDHAVWQNVSSVTLSFGGRRLQLEASKKTTTKNESVFTFLYVRVPFRDFLDMARVGKFSLSVDRSSFAVERAQTVGMRALARLCGAGDVALDSGSNASSRPSRPSPTSTRRPSRASDEFFPQTSRRTLTRREVENMSDGDLRLAINEMYARYGLGFKDKTLQARFEALGWYHPRDERTYEVITGLFSDIERANVDLLVGERKSRN